MVDVDDRQTVDLFGRGDVALAVVHGAGAGPITMIHSAFDQDAVSEMFDVHSDSPRPPEHPRNDVRDERVRHRRCRR